MPEFEFSGHVVQKDDEAAIHSMIENAKLLHHPKNFFSMNNISFRLEKSPTHILTNPHFNKATAFTIEERKGFLLTGLLPPTVETIDTQVKRAYKQLTRFTVPLSQHIYLSSLRERNVTLFYRLVIEHLEEIMPLIYTPTVGQACLEYGLQFRSCEGMYISIKEKGSIKSVLTNWGLNQLMKVAIIVVTDGSRILGLGDLGACGMGIPIGKLALYVAAGGFHPMTTLPICIDVGTNNEALREDEFYLGLRTPRIADQQYYELMDEFMKSVYECWPHAVVQFEDISNNHCFDLLDRYRHQYLCFNDDIQGTGAVIAAGFLNALKVAALHPLDCPILFVGAGSAAIGVAGQIIRVFVQEYKLEYAQIQNIFHVIDSKGLITTDRPFEIQSVKKPFARSDYTYQDTHELSIYEIVKLIKPKAIIGLSGQANCFTKESLQYMSTISPSPIIFALSNPTSKAECTFQDAYDATNGQVIFASGSPFDPIVHNGCTSIPSQGNNLYTFPGLGLGVWLSQAKYITDTVITEATIALANCVTQEELKRKCLYPPLNQVRLVSAKIAARVMEAVYKENLSRLETQPKDFLQYVLQNQYFPEYLTESFK